jgi:arylsulfatase A
VKIESAELYDLDADVGETKNIAAVNHKVMKKLLDYAEKAKEDLGDSLTKRVGKAVRDPGRLPPEPK